MQSFSVADRQMMKLLDYFAFIRYTVKKTPIFRNTTEALEGHFYLLLITYYLLLITYYLLLTTYHLLLTTYYLSYHLSHL